MQLHRTPLISITHASNQVSMTKLDTEPAFRIIPVSPLDIQLLGFQWRGKLIMVAVVPVHMQFFKLSNTAMDWAARTK